MKKVFVVSFLSIMISFLFVPDLFSQQARRGSLNSRNLVVTNEVDPTKEFHWDNISEVTWQTIYSNGYIVVKAVNDEKGSTNLIIEVRNK